MVGKFVFGMLSGGALVAGGFVIGSALFPLQPSAAANDPAPVATDPAPDPVPAAATTAPDQQAEAVPEPDAEAAEPAAATPPTAEAQPEPAPDTALAPEGEPTSDATTAETAAEAAPAEVPATTPSEPTLPAAEAETADAVSDSPPVAEPVAEVPPVPAAEPEPALPATAVVEAVDPPVIATPAADSSAETAPPAVAEVPKPDLPIAPLVLPQLDADAVLAALDDSALAPPPEAPEAAAPAVAEPELPEPEATEPKTAAPEVIAEATPEPTPEAAPETAEAAPLPESAPMVEAEVEPEPEPAAPAADGMPAPALDDSATARLPGTVAPEMPGNKPDTLPGAGVGEALPEPEVAILPEADADTGPVFKPAPGLGDATDGVIVGRLPRIGDPPAVEAETAEAEAAPVDDRPIAQFAATFENPDAKPVLAIVLIDPGTADLDREGLAALPFPVSFALDPLDTATPERAAIYRAAGKEVVMLATGIADGAQASDIEVAFQSMAQGLPEAVAVMDLPEVVFQNRRPLASLVVPVVGTQGRGLLTWDQGLNAADQVARREDIAAAVVFRDLASAGEDSAAIRRVLDRAVFKAGQDGRVAVAGTASPATVAALLEWTVEGRAATVAIGPLTAVMTIE